MAEQLGNKRGNVSPIVGTTLESVGTSLADITQATLELPRSHTRPEAMDPGRNTILQAYPHSLLSCLNIGHSIPMSGSEERPARNIMLTSPMSTFHTSQLPPSPDIQSISSSSSSYTSSEFQNIISAFHSCSKGSRTSTIVTGIASSQEFGPVPPPQRLSTELSVGVVIGTATVLVLLVTCSLCYRRIRNRGRPPVIDFHSERMVVARQTLPSVKITSPNVSENRLTIMTTNSSTPFIESPLEGVHSQRRSIPFGYDVNMMKTFQFLPPRNGAR